MPTSAYLSIVAFAAHMIDIPINDMLWLHRGADDTNKTETIAGNTDIVITVPRIWHAGYS